MESTGYFFSDLNQFDTDLKFTEEVIERINSAVKGLPKEKLRLHVCWGNYEGPHIHDVSLNKILPLILKANVKTVGNYHDVSYRNCFRANC